jgi:hypothetical protein
VPRQAHAQRLNMRGMRVRVEMTGSQKFRNVGKSQWVLMMIDPIISTCTRIARGLSDISCCCPPERRAPPQSVFGGLVVRGHQAYPRPLRLNIS